MKRAELLKLIKNIPPFNHEEAQVIEETIEWITSGAPLYRLHKPDFPKKHLVTYFLHFDITAEKVLLVDHRKANLWLPAGGHIEPDENPLDSVERECLEELGIASEFIQKTPLFISATETTGPSHPHIDVNLWYLLKGDASKTLLFDQTEFRSVHWFSFDEIPFDHTDQNLKTFIEKFYLYLTSIRCANDYTSSPDVSTSDIPASRGKFFSASKAMVGSKNKILIANSIPPQ